LELISSTDVLIGHSLQFDLNVMKIKHNKIVDTSVIYEHVKGPPLKPSLKWLATTFLDRVIQAGENTGDGHSSIEDATACLDLVKLKIQKGMLFGTNVSGMSIFQKLAKNGNKGDNEKFESLYLRYTQYDNQDQYQEHESHNVQYIYVKNDDEIVQRFHSNQEGKRFIVMNLREIELASKWCHIPNDYSGKTYEDDDATASEQYVNTNNRLQAVYDQLPDYSLMIVHSTTGDPREMNKLLEVKRHFNHLERNGIDVSKLTQEESWDINKQQQLMEATETARDSLTFVVMKLPKI
jgi:RNA exonuclease 1